MSAFHTRFAFFSLVGAGLLALAACGQRSAETVAVSAPTAATEPKPAKKPLSQKTVPLTSIRGLADGRHHVRGQDYAISFDDLYPVKTGLAFGGGRLTICGVDEKLKVTVGPRKGAATDTPDETLDRTLKNEIVWTDLRGGRVATKSTLVISMIGDDLTIFTKDHEGYALFRVLITRDRDNVLRLTDDGMSDTRR